MMCVPSSHGGLHSFGAAPTLVLRHPGATFPAQLFRFYWFSDFSASSSLSLASLPNFNIADPISWSPFGQPFGQLRGSPISHSAH